jgi:hypothetical protein
MWSITYFDIAATVAMMMKKEIDAARMKTHGTSDQA